MGTILPNVEDITTLGGGATVLQAEAIEEMEGKVLSVFSSTDWTGADAVTFS